MSKFIAGFVVTILSGTIFLTVPAHATSLVLPQQTDPAVVPATLVTTVPMKLESVSADGICGTTLDGKKQYKCIGATLSVSANDTVSKIKHFFIGAQQLCGVDERGVRCWKTEGKYIKPVAEIFAGADPERTRFAYQTICTEQSNKTVACYSPEHVEWGEGNGSQTILPPPKIFGPFKDLRDFQTSEDTICFLDQEKIVCESLSAATGNTQPSVPSVPLAEAKSISVTWESVCVLHKGGLECTRGRGGVDTKTFHIEGKWLTAKKLFQGSYDTVCATDKDDQPLCVKLGLESDEMTDATPTELNQPGLQILNFKANGNSRCATLDTATEKNVLYCGHFGATMKKVTALKDVRDFTVGIETVCAVTKDDLVSCFYDQTHRESPLPEDGSESHTAGDCRWNDSRFHCAKFEFDVDTSDIKHVIAASADSTSVYDLPCVIYETVGGIRTSKCFSASTRNMTAEPPSLTSDDTKIAATYEYACVYGGESLKCWGTPFTEATAPNFASVTKLLFGSGFGCAADQFGLVCWGTDMQGRGLEVPMHLSDAGAITDFTLGSQHACAITRKQTVECWGSSPESTAPAGLTGVTSIMASERTTCASSNEGVTCWGYRSPELLKPQTASR